MARNLPERNNVQDDDFDIYQNRYPARGDQSVIDFAHEIVDMQKQIIMLEAENKRLRKKMEEGNEFLDNTLEWINVKDKLPDDYQTVLVKHKDYCGIYIATYNSTLNKWHFQGEFGIVEPNEIKYWVPLPLNP